MGDTGHGDAFATITGKDQRLTSDVVIAWGTKLVKDLRAKGHQIDQVTIIAWNELEA